MNFLSYKSSDLNKKTIYSICKLKDSQWKYGLESQLSWYSKNVKPDDLHNMLFINNELIGYTLLRKRTIKLFQNNKIFLKKYLLFDTLIIDTKNRKQNLGSNLMDFNSKIILTQKLSSFLICNDDLVKFYEKYNWVILKNDLFQVMDHKFSTNGLICNHLNLVEDIHKIKRIHFYIYE